MRIRSRRNAVVVVIATTVILIISVLAVGNIVFFTDKQYADVTVISSVKKVLNKFKDIREHTHLDFSIPNTIHATISTDKDYAFAQDIPYWDNIGIDLYQNGDYGRIDVSDSDKCNLTSIFTRISNDESLLFFSNIANDSCLYLKEDETDVSNVPEPDPDDLSRFIKNMTYDFLAALPEECYKVDHGLFGKSKICMSATEKEFTEALVYSLTQNKDSNILRHYSSLKAFDDYISGFSDYKSENNYYTLVIETNHLGNITKAQYSQIIENHYKEYSISVGNNYLKLSVSDNESFFADNSDKTPKYNVTEYLIRYGKNTDGTYSIYGSYISNGEQLDVRGESVEVRNGRICGCFSVALTDNRLCVLDIPQDGQTVELYIEKDNKKLLDISASCEESLLAISEFKTSPPDNKYDNFYDYSELYSKDATYAEVHKKLQLSMILDYYKNLVEAVESSSN